MTITPDDLARSGREDGHQAAIFCALRNIAPQHPEVMLAYHIANGGARDTITAGKLKAGGVKAGVPDIHLPVARRGFHSLYVELKVPAKRTHKQGGLSDVQVTWKPLLEQHGNCVIVAYGWRHAVRAIVGYLGGDTSPWAG